MPTSALPSGRFVASPMLLTQLFNRDWGGYPGDHSHSSMASCQSCPYQFLRRALARTGGWTLRPPEFRMSDTTALFGRMGRTLRLSPSQTTPFEILWEHPTELSLAPPWSFCVLHPIQHAGNGAARADSLDRLRAGRRESAAGQEILCPSTSTGRQTAATEADYQVFNHLLDARGKPGGPNRMARRCRTRCCGTARAVGTTRRKPFIAVSMCSPYLMIWLQANIRWSAAFIGAKMGSVCSARPARIRSG